MANEFQHKSVGPSLTQGEFESAGDSHQFDNQATGDMLYASSSTNLRRLGMITNGILTGIGSIPTWLAVGSNGDLLTVSSGSPAYTTPGSGGAVPAYIVKASNETVNSGGTGDTLQNDDDLTFSVAASSTYVVEGVMFVTSAATPDFKFQWSLPASATIDGVVRQTSSSILKFSEAAATTIAYAADDDIHHFTAILITAGTAGTAVLQWAQNTSDASNTTMNAGSWLRWIKVA